MSMMRFLRDRRGSVAPMFGLMAVPLLGFTGAAVDYSRANSVRSAVQSALDATALALSKEAQGLTATQLQAKATTYFNANFNRTEAGTIVVTPTFTSNPTTLNLTGSGSLPTTFLAVLGVPSIAINSNATVTWGTTKLRVALALDNTGSMSDNNKIGALKTATHQLLTTFQGISSNPGDVLVAIVPFSKDVNVGGPSNYSATWIDWTAWDAANGQWCKKNGQCASDPIGNATWTPNNHSTWNGCITDRGTSTAPGTAAGNDQKVTAPSAGTPSTLFPAEQYAECPAKLMGLSSNWSQLNQLVDDMTPNGTTNQPIGLVWAWHALTPGAPLNAPTITDTTTKQIIILLSDGMNTQDRWYGDGASISTDVDARMYSGGAGTCKNIKDAGIEIYTVQVNVNNADPLSTVMKNCASKPENFFMLTTSGQIVDTFQQIGTQLAKLHLTQ
jgi:Flp pilus assembly protein TadG